MKGLKIIYYLAIVILFIYALYEYDKSDKKFIDTIKILAALLITFFVISGIRELNSNA